MKRSYIRNTLCTTFMLAASVVYGQSQDALDLPKSPYPYGHPMLMYLKSSKPIPDAHALCLRIYERRIDRLYGYWSSYSVTDDMVTRRRGMNILKKDIDSDWGVVSHELYAKINREFVAQLAKDALELTTARRALEDVTNGKDLDSSEFARRLDGGRYKNDTEAIEGLLGVLDIIAAEKGVANAEAGYESSSSAVRYFECAYRNNLPPTISDQ